MTIAVERRTLLLLGSARLGSRLEIHRGRAAPPHQTDAPFHWDSARCLRSISRSLSGSLARLSGSAGSFHIPHSRSTQPLLHRLREFTRPDLRTESEHVCQPHCVREVTVRDLRVGVSTQSSNITGHEFPMFTRCSRVGHSAKRFRTTKVHKRSRKKNNKSVQKITVSHFWPTQDTASALGLISIHFIVRCTFAMGQMALRCWDGQPDFMSSSLVSALVQNWL